MTVCTFLLVFVPRQVSAGVGTLAERTMLRKQQWQCGLGCRAAGAYTSEALRPQATDHHTEAGLLPLGLSGK